METNVSDLGAEMKQSSIYLFFIATIILASCGGASTTPQISGGGIQSSQIKEPQIGTPYTEITIQEIRTSNCDGTNPTTTVSRSLVQEQTTFFEVAVEAGGLIRGTPIPTVLEAELEAKIKTALGSNLGNKFEQTISTVLETQPGQAWQHKIFWNETKVKGVIDVVYQNGTATLNFEKVIGIELDDRTSESLVCNGNSANPISTQVITTLETQPPVIQPTTIAPTLFVPNSKCPSVIKREAIEQWAQIGDVSTKQESQKYIDDFDRQRMGGEFVVNDVLPAGVAIVTDFGNGKSNIYLTLPVRAIVHYHSFGVFEVTSDYTAIQTGACMTIIP